MAERRLHGLQRVLGVNALVATAYGNVGASIFYGLGLVAALAVGLTPVVFVITGVLGSAALVNERQRRIWAAAEALSHGRGRIAAVARVAGSRSTRSSAASRSCAMACDCRRGRSVGQLRGVRG